MDAAPLLLPSQQRLHACLPLPLRYVAVCTAVLVAVINWFAVFLPRVLSNAMQGLGQRFF
jgi:hypothetical protein